MPDVDSTAAPARPDEKKRRHAAIRHGTSNFAPIEHEAYDSRDPKLAAALLRQRGDLLLDDRPWFEPFAGAGNLVDPFRAAGIRVVARDLHPRRADIVGDFFATKTMPKGCGTVVTNGPFSEFSKTVRHALTLTEPIGGTVAIVMPLTFVHAKGRRDLFEEWCFSGLIVCGFRVDWFPDDRRASLPPTFYAWALWDWLREIDEPPALRLDFGDE